MRSGIFLRPSEVVLRGLDARVAELVAELSLAAANAEVKHLVRLAHQCHDAIAACRRSPFTNQMLARLVAKIRSIEAQSERAIRRGARASSS